MKPEAKSPQAWIRPQIRALTAYHVPDPGDLVKLDAMENPWPWPGDLTDAWLESLRGLELNRYPDPGARELSEHLRASMGVPDDAALLLGNGSDELIQMLALSLAEPGRVIMAPEPTFVMYRLIATVAGCDYRGVPLAQDFSLDRGAMLAAIERHRPAILFLAWPNNPTGTLFDAGVIEQLIEAAPGLVVIDEAYAPFTDASLLPRVGEFPNLLVLRTVSKMGLAGLRLGYLAGPRDWLAEIDKTRLPYNINALTQASALFALRHRALLDEQARRIREQRDRLFSALAALPGVTAWPSEANFILFRVAGADAVFAGLRERGVLIKNLSPAGGALADCLRVTVGTGEENARFLDALRGVLADGGLPRGRG
ncbi:MAG TPA: histidinol-phosphate transaminase [Gammaproteobacteria bacterium]|nr:histidinol-phosphate transaminase [Gammaproteobacteria bacterium]